MEHSRTAHVLACVRNDSVLEWNHSEEDGYSIQTQHLSGECGLEGQFIILSTITKLTSGPTQFVASIKWGGCEGKDLYQPTMSEPVSCQCAEIEYCRKTMAMLIVLYN